VTSDTTSVRIDPSPILPDNTAAIIVSHLCYMLSNRALKTLYVHVASEKTVRDFVQLIERNGYHQYRFSKEGIGCRYWIYNLIGLLRDNAFLMGNVEVEEAMDAVTKVWTNGGVLAPEGNQSGLGKGTFY
jgi:hypothetical protein